MFASQLFSGKDNMDREHLLPKQTDRNHFRTPNPGKLAVYMYNICTLLQANHYQYKNPLLYIYSYLIKGIKNTWATLENKEEPNVMKQIVLGNTRYHFLKWEMGRDL